LSKTPSPSPASSSPTKPRRWKWILLALLLLVLAVGWASGLLGLGLAVLRSAVFPSDKALVAYIPVDSAGVLVFDPHQLQLKTFGAEGGKLRQLIDGRRVDVERATGIDLALDVDKVAVSPGLLVARGRFSGKSLAARLSERRYLPSEHRGALVLERAGEDAVAIVDDAVLLYGDAAKVTAALDAAGEGHGLDSAPSVMERLDAIGWDHPLIGTLAFGEGGASLRDILTGATGPRAFTLGVGVKGGVDIDVLIETASVGAAGELTKLLDARRQDLELLQRITADEAVAKALVDLARDATITQAPERPDVRIHVHVPPETVELLGESAGRFAGKFDEAWSALRLYQLLVPTL
jgi:hypothetical protein